VAAVRSEAETRWALSDDVRAWEAWALGVAREVDPVEPVMDYASLKARHRAEREGWHANLSLRVHRALSWLERAEELAAQEDPDGEFIFLWIAFNAA